MKYSNTVEYNISTKLDSSGLQKLKTELQQVELKLQKMGNQKLLNPDDFSNARTQIRGLSDALSKAFDPTLGITNLSKLNEELKSSGVTTEGLRSAFSQLGTDGQIAFNNVIGELGKLDTGILRTNSQIDKLFTTFSNTFRWGLVSSFFSQFMNAIHSSVNYVKELDDSLTQIMLVTDYNRDSMNEFARSANEAAKAVSMTTTGMTNASLIFAQQGYNLGQSQELATLSAKVANASQQDTATTSDQITAYMNAYGLENNISELTQAMDNWALIANISAADVGELAQASQRAASMANAVGVSGEQLASQIATIESVTREAPEQIGNGLKTLYARFSDITAGGEDEDGFSLGKVTSELNKIGVQVLDEMGQIRDVGDIMEDLMVIWDDLDQTSKVAASQALAGKYQVNRFMALMDNSDMYEEYKGATGANAAGTLDIMNEEYAQSIEGRSAKLQASLEGLFSTIFNTDDIYPWMDAAQNAIDLLQQFFDALGGGKTVLLGLSSLLTQIFSKNIAQEINNATINNAVQEQRKANLENKQAALSNMGMANPELDNGMSNYIIDFAKQINSLDLNKEQAEQANNILMELIQNANAAGQASDELATKISGIGTALVSTLGEDSKTLAPILEDGIINDTLLRDFLDSASDDQLKELFEGSRQAIAQTKNELKEFSQALQTFQQETKENDQSADELKNSIERLRDAFSYIKNTIDTSTYNQYDEELRNIIETLENSDDASDDVSVLTNRIAKLYEELDKIKGVNVEKIQQISSDLERSNFKQINTQGAFEGTKQVGNAFLNSANKTGDIKSIIDTINAVQQLTFAWQTFQNLGSIWKNNKLSDGEKFLQTFMSLTSAILMMQPAIEVLSKKFGVLNLQQAANVLTSAKLTIAKHAETIAFGASSVAAGDLAAKQWLLVASEEAATIATTALKTALTLLASPVGIIGIMGIATAIGFVQAQAEEARQQALDNLEDAKSALQEVEDLKDKVGTFKESYDAYKESGEGGDKLIEQANSIAQAMKEAGAEEEANAIHLAALRAEAAGTAENFSILANSIDSAQGSMSQDANAEAIMAANKLLETENVSIEDVVRHQKMLKDAQEELNNLDPLDAGYEAEKERLEHLIATLKDAKLAEEELVNAANVAVGAGVNSGMQEIAKTEGQQMQVYGKGDATGAGPPALAAGVMDWSSMQEYLSQTVEGFGSLDELDQLAIAAQNVATEAQAAEIQVRQLLLANESLDESTTQHYSRTGDYTLYGREGIQDVMQNEGFDSEQQVKILASLDENASEQEIMAKIQEIKAKMETTNDFDLALKATLDPEQAEEMLQDRINNYEPTDEDINADQFKSMANYIHGADDSAFEEGGMFEDLPSDIRDSADALEDFVEGILRYEDAISTLAEKEEDWREALSDGADLADRVEAIDELKETYSDFLDLGEEVSDSFAENTDNLDLMAEAAEGDVDAYNDLLAAASEDIAINVYGIDESSEALAGMSDYLRSDAFEDVEVGMSIQDEGFYDNLNQMIAEGNWSREQIEAYLNDIGCSLDPSGIVEGANEVASVANQKGHEAAAGLTITSEVDSMTAQEEDTNEATSLHVRQIPGDTWKADVPTVTVQTAGMPASTSVPISGTAPPSFEVTAEPVETKDTKQMSASSVKAKQGGSGTTTIKPGSVKKANSGGAKSNHASRPSSGGGGGGGGGKGKSCFIAGTLVSIRNNEYQYIENIHCGDVVLSYNEKTRQNEYSQVLQTMTHKINEEVYLICTEETELNVTGNHKFFVKRNNKVEWIEAADLRINDLMFFADYSWHEIWHIEANIKTTTVYNFEVSHNHNYYVGIDQILAHNKGGKGGSGGGGGGKAKTAEKKEKDKVEKKYYEEVDKQLDHVDETLKKVEKTADKLVGTQARAKQNEQLKLLQKELNLQQKKLDILQKQEKVDVSKKIKEADANLEKLLNEEGLNLKIVDFEYDEEGFIKNLDATRESIVNGKNALIDRYNQIAGKDSLSEEDEAELKRIDKQIKKYEDFGKVLEKNGTRYNEVVLEEEKIQTEMEKIKDTMQDIAIDALKTSQEALDNLKDLREEWAEFSAGLYDESKGESFLGIDNPRRKFKEIANSLTSIYQMTGDEAKDFYQDLIDENNRLLENAQDRLKNAKTKAEKESIQTEIDTYKTAIEFNEKRQQEIVPGIERSLNNGMLQMALDDERMLLDILNNWKEGSRDNPIFGDNKAALLEMLKEVQSRIGEGKKEYEELIEDLKDAALDTMDDVADQWDRHLDRFDRVNDQLEEYADTYSLIYGDESYAMQESVLMRQGQIYEKQYEAAKQAYNQASEAYADAAAKYLDPETGLPKEGYKEFMEHLEDSKNDAEDRMRSIAKDSAETYVKAFEIAVKKSTQDILEATIGEKNFDHIDRNWEWDKEYIDKYQDGIEKAYEMDKLRNRYIDMLNNAQGASLQTQNKIRTQMQEQLDLLKGQETISEYDVKLANAKLEILQKQIALEDAQRNKNRMQLRRDTQGNYRYVYTADKDSVSKAQQELVDSEYDAYEMSKQQQMANYDDMLNAYKRFLSQREEILSNNNLSEKEKIEQNRELYDRFQKYMKSAGEDFADATAGTLDILNWLTINGTDYTATSAKTMLQDLLDEEGRIREESDALWLTTAENMANNVIPLISEAVKQANDEIEQKMETSHDKLVGDDGTGGLLGEISNGANDFGAQVENASKKVDLLVTSTTHLTDALRADSEEFKKQIELIQSLQNEAQEASNRNSSLARSYEETQRALEKSEALKRNYETDLDKLRSGKYVFDDNGKIVSKEELEAQKRQAEEARKAKQSSSSWSPYPDAYAIWMNGAWGGGGYWYGPYIAAGHSVAQADAVLDLFNRGYGYSWMDTGGYTGSWGSDEGMSNAKNGKLAVLHQKELVLNAQDTENILAAVSIIRQVSASAQAALNNTSTASRNNISTTYNPTTEQRVEIQATFPNATDAEDIRQALIGLSDRAYQYAHKVI